MMIQLATKNLREAYGLSLVELGKRNKDEIGRASCRERV